MDREGKEVLVKRSAARSRAKHSGPMAYELCHWGLPLKPHIEKARRPKPTERLR
jgi:hypothetical protein